MDRLTARHIEILPMICAEGLPRKAVARQLGIAEHTVKNHVTATIHRLGVTTYEQACYRYGREGTWQAIPAMRAYEV